MAFCVPPAAPRRALALLLLRGSTQHLAGQLHSSLGPATYGICQRPSLLLLLLLQVFFEGG